MTIVTVVCPKCETELAAELSDDKSEQTAVIDLSLEQLERLKAQMPFICCTCGAAFTFQINWHVN